VKYFEYSAKFEHGLLPGHYFTVKEDPTGHQFIFFSFYFMMTGLHGFHILVGVFVLIWINAKAPRTYLLTLFALLTLTVITVGVSCIDFGAGNIVVAVTVATIKAFLVGLIFMHLLHDKPINAISFCAAFLFLSLLFLFTFLDEDSRNPIITTNPPAGRLPPPNMAVATAVDGNPSAQKKNPRRGSRPRQPMQTEFQLPLPSLPGLPLRHRAPSRRRSKRVNGGDYTPGPTVSRVGNKVL
jgi:caa(3)-type oxidase subunit IV